MKALELPTRQAQGRRRRKEPELTDLPTVTINDAAFFFNMGRRQFRRRFDEVYSDKIQHVETKKGRRLRLMDVIEAAFPDADDSIRYWMAYEYLKRAAARRRKNRNGSGGSSDV